MTRETEIADGLAAVRARIAVACEGVGRTPKDVTLIVVTKFFGASDVRILADLGVGDVAENRHQEAVDKAAECADLGLRWHFVGGLQSNKAAAVARYAACVHSLDRLKLVGGLERGAAERGERLDVLLQVSLDPPDTGHRAGVDPRQLADLAERAAGAEHLDVRGLMAVAPSAEDPAVAFARLEEVREEFLSDHPDATWLSAGMSGDLEAAIAAGATHVRVGSAVLGSRPEVQ